MNFSKYKIISKEDIRIKNFKYFHILVPCFCYEITIDFKDGEFNILQSTVQELLKIDSGLRNEPEKLATMLGFDEHKELIEIILEDIKLSEEFQTKTKSVYIFKERYGGSFLPFVLQEKLSYSEFREYKNEFKIINNKNDISAKYDFDGLSDDFALNPQKIYGIIVKHNKNNKRLDVLGFNASNAEDTHFEILLLCKICFDENGKFFITDGYNNNYNSTLADIFRQTKPAFVKELQ